MSARATPAALAAWLAAAALSPMPAAGQAPAPATLAAIVQFNTMCNNCHEGECSGRMSFDSGSAAARGHIERHLGGPASDTHVAALFAMLRHVKESCRHYPVVPIRTASGTWQAEELAPWRNQQAGAYFIPLGKLPLGQRRLRLSFDGPADGHARIDDDSMEVAADERLCQNDVKTLEFSAVPDTAYFLHLKSGKAMLCSIEFR